MCARIVVFFFNEDHFLIVKIEFRHRQKPSAARRGKKKKKEKRKEKGVSNRVRLDFFVDTHRDLVANEVFLGGG